MAAGFGLLVIVASGILLFLLFSGIGEEEATPSPTPEPTIELVETPDFVGRREAGALALAERRGVVLEIEYHGTDEYEAGRIIEQLPEPETEVPAGTTVQVTVATQVETVVVPDVHGIKEDNALMHLEDAGLHAGVRLTASGPLPEGYVVGTEPRAGASATRGTPIDYTVSTGPAIDPTQRPAATSQPTPARTPTPTPGLTAPPTPFPSAEVVLVGDFQCLPLATARTVIEEARLLVGFIYPEDPPPEDSWIVHDQLPKPGESIPVGSAVDLMLEDPLEPCPPG